METGVQTSRRRVPWLRLAAALALAALAAVVATAYPPGPFQYGSVVLGLVALLCPWLCRGWSGLCMIAGVYAGFIFDARVKSGDKESQF